MFVNFYIFSIQTSSLFIYQDKYIDEELYSFESA